MLRKIRSLVSNSNYIGIWDKALTKRECDILIKQFEKSPVSYGFIYSNSGKLSIDFDVKKCKQLDNPSFKDSSIVSNIVYPRLVSYLSKYRKAYPSVDYMSRFKISDKYAFQKYEDESDGYKLWHQEHGAGEASGRVFAWTFYLNNAQSGTEFLHFPTVHAKIGRCVIWPASWPYLHRGVPNKGLKYIITGWMGFHEE